MLVRTRNATREKYMSGRTASVCTFALAVVERRVEVLSVYALCVTALDHPVEEIADHIHLYARCFEPFGIYAASVRRGRHRLLAAKDRGHGCVQTAFSILDSVVISCVLAY